MTVNLSHFSVPRLLVSVRNDTEAEAALAGGCDVLDVKEPGRGAMGMADVSTIVEVVARVRVTNSAVPVSVALGEARDWESQNRILRLPAQVAYLKLGTAGLGTHAGWGKRFAQVKRGIVSEGRADSCECGESASDAWPGSGTWIAVVYADWEIAGGPCPEEVLEGVRECGCAGILIDTFSKESGRLLDRLSIDRLQSLAAAARSHGLEFALAGRLLPGDLPRLASICLDIVGIRSAACRAGIRTGEIDASAVRTFRESLRSAASRSLAPGDRPVHPGRVTLAPHG
jgi:uncharacterized protein (UPF0264 family)